jgi:hypothetical protein
MYCDMQCGPQLDGTSISSVSLNERKMLSSTFSNQSEKRTALKLNCIL